jgi:hypothetical protein
LIFVGNVMKALLAKNGMHAGPELGALIQLNAVIKGLGSISLLLKKMEWENSREYRIAGKKYSEICWIISMKDVQKAFTCVAATVMDIEELEEAVLKAKKESEGLEIKEKAKILHLLLDKIARQKNYTLKLRK